MTSEAITPYGALPDDLPLRELDQWLADYQAETFDTSSWERYQRERRLLAALEVAQVDASKTFAAGAVLALIGGRLQGRCEVAERRLAAADARLAVVEGERDAERREVERIRGELKNSWLESALQRATLTAQLAAVRPSGRNRMTTAIDLITEERMRQIAKGYDAKHDDAHDLEQIARAAACYAGGLELFVDSDDRAEELGLTEIWPWEGVVDDALEGKDRISQLVIAGALIVAEIERLQRLTPPAQPADVNADE